MSYSPYGNKTLKHINLNMYMSESLLYRYKIENKIPIQQFLIKNVCQIVQT